TDITFRSLADRSGTRILQMLQFAVCAAVTTETACTSRVRAGRWMTIGARRAKEYHIRLRRFTWAASPNYRGWVPELPVHVPEFGADAQETHRPARAPGLELRQRRER